MGITFLSEPPLNQPFYQGLAKQDVQAYWCYCNRMPGSREVIKNRKLLLTVPLAGKTKLKVTTGCLVSTAFQGERTTMPSWAESGLKKAASLFYKGLMPLPWTLHSVTEAPEFPVTHMLGYLYGLPFILKRLEPYKVSCRKMVPFLCSSCSSVPVVSIMSSPRVPCFLSHSLLSLFSGFPEP